MTAPTGLHGWIQSNDGRSTGLFLGFLATIQLIAPLALVGPLVLIDIDHAPFFGWGGYLLRYAPLVLVASIVWFVVQLWWHVETVKRAVGFHFVDGGDEPRLCAVIEPLIIVAGLPTPFVGVIDSDARNAFACGIGRKKAVVVVTRGLLDALSDAELAAVLAHELSHVRNGDIRLMAAANIFMAALTRLHGRNWLRFTWVHGLLALAVPAVLPLSLAATLLGRWLLRAGQVSRLLIASSREFVADAQAAQWTKDPGALAAALLKVDGRHRVAHARAEDDAMMIAGESEGPGATHPTIAQRVAALARVTGSMVFNATAAPGDGDWTATTSRDAVERLARGRRAMATQAIARVRRGDENVFGLTTWGTLALVATVGALGGLHWQRLGQPRALAATFDPRPLGGVVSGAIGCELSPFSRAQSARCDAATGSLRAFEGQEGTLGGWMAAIGRGRRERGVVKGEDTALDPLSGVTAKPIVERYRGQSGRLTPTTVERTSDGLYIDLDGAETHNRPRRLIVAEVEQVGCFLGDPAPMEAAGPLPMGPDGPTQDNVRRIRYEIDRVAEETNRGNADWALISYYLDRRKASLHEAYMYYGQPGLAMALNAFAADGPRAALERVRQAAGAVAIPAEVTSVQRAELAALLRDPAAFVPCRSLAAR